jgi:hypothetical protein
MSIKTAKKVAVNLSDVDAANLRACMAHLLVGAVGGRVDAASVCAVSEASTLREALRRWADEIRAAKPSV